jgi:spore germination protein PF
MPSIVGPVQIVTVNGGIVQFGDTAVISPKSNSKSTSGSGSANTGNLINTNSGISGSNVLDTNLVDQPNIGNG